MRKIRQCSMGTKAGYRDGTSIGNYLFASKGDKMNGIVRKSVELGAHKIVPFSAKRSVVKLDEKKAVKKQERWQLIAKGAVEQSGRGA